MAAAYAESVVAHGGGGGAGKSPLAPTAVHCNALLNAYCRGGRWMHLGGLRKDLSLIHI